MSLDVYLQCFGGEPAGISRAAVRALFPIVEQTSEPDYWSVLYDPANSCKINITPAASCDDLITSLSVNRPCGDLRFWESILAILRMGSVILYWAGGGPLVGSDGVAAELPAEIVEALGQPLSVSTAQDIVDAIRAS